MSESIYFKVAQAIASKAAAWRFRQGEVTAVGTDYTVTVRVAGSSETVSGVRYIGPTPPLPGTGVWLVVSASDLFAVGSLAAAGRSITPRVYRTSDASIADATDEVVTWEADEFDGLGHWSSGTDLTVQVPGRYQAVAQVRFAANATGFRAAWIRLNGSTQIARTQVLPISGSPSYFQVVSTPVALVAGDDLQLVVRQNSGGALSLIGGAYDTALALTYLGP